MLEIKTIMRLTKDSNTFDREVNEALAEGWELVRREILPPFAVATNNHIERWERTLYAELERMTEPEEEPEDDGTAEWVVSRNPSAPYRCNKCGYSTAVPIHRCPGCERAMVSYRE